MIKLTRQTLLNLLMLAVVTAFGINIKAQPLGDDQHREQHGPPRFPDQKEIKEMVSKLAEEVGLNEEQTSRVEELYLAHFEDVKTQMEEGERPSREDMEQQKSDFEKKVKSVLSEEQMAKYDVFLKEHQRKGPPRR
ncbi:hypothetical protein [Plebeiibacterium marinum]|uniref:Spy/CpxP family protein refolding chaperone n=1 Tax=Plebeiibacterium marinum TaxID=2992111 RepID=A0AAE3MBW4_9BACT|nr:hypothetical protein [Plebeiobacterium marinum]MCW3804906.1 hypothetical protein [Plebeiobacterium marinum]